MQIKTETASKNRDRQTSKFKLKNRLLGNVTANEWPPGLYHVLIPVLKAAAERNRQICDCKQIVIQTESIYQQHTVAWVKPIKSVVFIKVSAEALVCSCGFKLFYQLGENLLSRHFTNAIIRTRVRCLEPVLLNDSYRFRRKLDFSTDVSRCLLSLGHSVKTREKIVIKLKAELSQNQPFYILASKFGQRQRPSSWGQRPGGR